jgi:hypothetical protein
MRRMRAVRTMPVGFAGAFWLVLCASVVLAACRRDRHNVGQPQDSVAAASAPRASNRATATAPATTTTPEPPDAPATPAGIGGSPGANPAKMRRETVDFRTCKPEKPSAPAEEEPGDDLMRCPLSSGLVAQQDGSACFDVNRLVDEHNEDLFTSELQAPKGTVFVTDRKFVLYRCEDHPVAVLQAGQLYAEFTSPQHPCHGAKPLRTTYLVEDIHNQKRFDDVSLKRAHELLAEIAKHTPCGRLER